MNQYGKEVKKKLIEKGLNQRYSLNHKSLNAIQNNALYYYKGKKESF